MWAGRPPLLEILDPPLQWEGCCFNNKECTTWVSTTGHGLGSGKGCLKLAHNSTARWAILCTRVLSGMPSLWDMAGLPWILHHTVRAAPPSLYNMPYPALKEGSPLYATMKWETSQQSWRLRFVMTSVLSRTFSHSQGKHWGVPLQSQRMALD